MTDTEGIPNDGLDDDAPSLDCTVNLLDATGRVGNLEGCMPPQQLRPREPSRLGADIAERLTECQAVCCDRIVLVFTSGFEETFTH